MKVKDIRLGTKSIKLRVVLPEMTEDLKCIYKEPEVYMESEVNFITFVNEILIFIK